MVQVDHLEDQVKVAVVVTELIQFSVQLHPQVAEKVELCQVQPADQEDPEAVEELAAAVPEQVTVHQQLQHKEIMVEQETHLTKEAEEAAEAELLQQANRVTADKVAEPEIQMQ